MRLLVLTSRFPHPLDKGDKLRAFHQIVELARRHEVILCALSDCPVKPDSLGELERHCRRIEVLRFSRWRGWLRALTALAGRRPLQAAYFFDRDLARRVRAVIGEESPDHVYCQLIRCAAYLEGVDLPKTLDFMDAFSWGMEQRAAQAPGIIGPLLRLESRRLRCYERTLVDRFDDTTVITAADRAQIDHPQRARIVVVGNGVDIDTFHPRPSTVDIDLLFVGNMGYPPNVDAAHVLVREILPRVRELLPSVRVLIAGTSPTAAVRRLAGDGVEVSGWVEDIGTCYARSRVFVSPMRFGTGLQNKLLQAMAMALPCVTTPAGERSLEWTPNGLRIGRDPEELAALCVELLTHPQDARTLGESGRALVRRDYGWASTVDTLDRVLSPADRGATAIGVDDRSGRTLGRRQVEA